MSLVIVLLTRLLRSTEEVARFLHTLRPSPVVTAGDASTGVPTSAPDASRDGSSERAPRALARTIEPPEPEDASVPDAAAPTEDAMEDTTDFPPDAGFVPEAAPLAQAPEPV